MYLRDPRAADTDADTDFSLLLSVVSISALSLRCKVGQVCEEVMRVPLVNMAWEQALAMWGQYGMNADEHRRRTLTRTFHSSSVRADMAASKFLAAQVVDCDKQDFKDGYSFFFFLSPDFQPAPWFSVRPRSSTTRRRWNTRWRCLCRSTSPCPPPLRYR